MSDDKTQQFPPVSAERIKRRRDVNFDSPDPDDREIAAICQMALDSITPSHEATVGETAEERRLRHRLEKIDAALDELGAPKTEAAHGLTMELSRVGRIKRLAQSATRERKDMDQETIFAALVELGRRIEACGASVELTNAVILCSDLRMAVGNQWNPPDEYAEQRVRKALAVTEKKLCPPSP
jgi:hypothetical protein